MKKALAVFLCAALLVGNIAPTLGEWFVWDFSLSVSAETDDDIPEDRVDYSNLTINQYIAKVLLSTDYVGDANGYELGRPTVYHDQLEQNYLDADFASTARWFTESLERNNAFMASVASWKFATFDPAAITDEMLTEKGYYTSIILNILDVTFKDNEYLDLLNNEFGQLSRTTLSTATDVAKEFDNIDAENLKAQLDDTTKKAFIEALVERYENSGALCESFGKGLDFVSTALETLNSAEEISKTLCSYMLLAQLGKDVKGVLHALYQNCDASNTAMKAALLETYTVCSDSINMAIVGVIDTGAEVLNKSFSAIVGSAWKACVSSFAGGFVGGLLIGQTIGKAISNFCFSSDTIVEQYFALRAVVDFEDLMVDTVISLGEEFDANQSADNADKYLKSIEMLISTYNLGSDYVLDFARTVKTKGLINKVLSGLGNDTTLEVYEDTVEFVKEIRNRNKVSLLSIEGYAWHYEYDAPAAYARLFASVESTPVYRPIEEPVYMEPTVFPEEERAIILEYVVENDRTITITGCNPSSYGKVVIPAEIAGLPVKKIDSNAFKNIEGITELEILGSVTTIDYRAFSGCTNLSSVTLNTGLQYLNSYAFSGTAITSITIPNTVVSWSGISPFEGANNLKTVIFEYGMLKIPEHILQNCSSVTNVVIPNGVTTIGGSAFRDCTGLTTITIPDSVTEIGQYAFSDCTGLTTIEIPDSVITIENYAFSGCTGLTEIEVPSSVTTIDYRAFSGCTNLSSVTLNTGLQYLNSYAFSGTAITSITIPNTVVSWSGISPFEGANNLKTVIFEYGMLKIPEHILQNCSSVTNVVIPNGVTTIGGSAFRDCAGLTTITIPDSVTEIGQYAFSGCTGLTEVVIPNSVTTIDYRAFSGCTNLSSVTLNTGLQYLNGYAFSGTAITSITIPNTVVSWSGISPFEGANNLKTVIFEYGMLKIPEHILQNCSSVTNVVIPNGVTTIGGSAFRDCTGLTTIAIPDSVTTIESNAFNGCTNLQTIYAVKGSVGYQYAIDNNIGVFEIACSHSSTETVMDSYKTCEEDGISRVVCTACGETLQTIVDPATGHNFSTEQILIAPSCKNEGLKNMFCSKCGDMKQIAISKTAHTYLNACDYDCNVCGATREVAEHVYDSNSDAVCNECGFVRVVTEAVVGDANGDGKVNNRDLGLLQQYLNDWDVIIDLVAADFNQNGTVNNRDLGLLQQFLTQ